MQKYRRSKHTNIALCIKVKYQQFPPHRRVNGKGSYYIFHKRNHKSYLKLSQQKRHDRREVMCRYHCSPFCNVRSSYPMSFFCTHFTRFICSTPHHCKSHRSSAAICTSRLPPIDTTLARCCASRTKRIVHVADFKSGRPDTREHRAALDGWH